MLATRLQKKIFVIGRNIRLRSFEVCTIGRINRTRIDSKRARTPPNLLGIDRRIAYAKRKYHSGLMWGGVTRGFAGIKLSGSPRMFGAKVDKDVNAASIIAKPKTSLYE